MDFQNISRSTVTFQSQASGLRKFLLCVVTTSGSAAAPPAPGSSAEPLVTLADSGSAEDPAGRGADGNRQRGIIEAWIEDRHVGPFGVIGDDDGVARAVIDGEALANFPGVLREAFVHVGAEDGVRAMTDF